MPLSVEAPTAPGSHFTQSSHSTGHQSGLFESRVLPQICSHSMRLNKNTILCSSSYNQIKIHQSDLKRTGAGRSLRCCKSDSQPSGSTSLQCNVLQQIRGSTICSKCDESSQALQFVKLSDVASLSKAPLGAVVEGAGEEEEVPCRESTSHMQALPFLEPDARKRPLWLKARCHTSSVCSLSTCTLTPATMRGIMR